jgi:hypothetical protein
VAWGSNVEIAKAISAIGNPTRDNVSERMGEKHKVRNFYNNIFDPQSTHGDVTIDTHAVAAALLRPSAIAQAPAQDPVLKAPDAPPALIFVFPGYGAQYAGMAITVWGM